jgi:hypothetical protein
MSTTVLDLRVNGNLPIYLTKGISYPAITFTFGSGSTMPTGFTLTVFHWDAPNTARVFTVGNGLTIQGNLLIWNLPIVTQNVGFYEGKLESDTAIYGSATRVKIRIKVSE